MSETKSSQKKRPTELQHVESFNRRIKILTNDLVKRFPNDATIARIQKRINLSIDVTPLFVIKTTGEYLYAFKDQIYKADADFFLENDYDREVKQAVNEEKADLAKYVMPKVKEAWRKLDEDSRKEYAEYVAALLDDYIDYRLAAASS